MSITRDITATVTEEGSVTVPARILGDLLARGSSPLATLGSDGLNLEVGLGDLEAKLRLIDDTPPPPIRVVSAESTPASLSALEVERAGAVAVASSGDLQRPVLAGVHLGPTMAEATDTYRVARTILTTWDLDLVVPADLVRLVAAERSDVTVSFDGRVIAFRTHDASWTTPVIATAFPAIPHFAIPTNETLTQTGTGSSQPSSPPRFCRALIELRSTGGDLVVSSENLEVGRIESKVPQVGATAVEALFTARLSARRPEAGDDRTDHVPVCGTPCGDSMWLIHPADHAAGDAVTELGPGLYEQLITDGLRAQLDELVGHLPVDERPLNSADASDRIAWHVSQQVERALLDVGDEKRVKVGLQVARALLDRLGELVDVDQQAMLADPASVLHAILRRKPDGTPAAIAGPLIPLLDTTLLTNAPGEPTLWSQLRSEIESADAIDVVMAFIRRSGIGPLLDSLRRHREAGRPLRVLTTTYTDSTERRALDQLVDLGAEVRISYDLSTTRLHAKAWVFHRHSGFSTAYVGSSNLTHSAQVTAGVERSSIGCPQS
jgi:hypothetical protein